MKVRNLVLGAVAAATLVVVPGALVAQGPPPPRYQNGYGPQQPKTTEITAVPTSTIAMSTGIPAFLAGTAALIGKDFAVAITLAFSTS